MALNSITQPTGSSSDDDCFEEEQPQNDVVEEESQEEDEEDEEEEEEEEEKYPEKMYTVKSAKIPPPESPAEFGSESDTDSDSTFASPNASDFTIKPIISNPKKPEPNSIAKRVLDTELDRNESRTKKMKWSSDGLDDDDEVEENTRKGSAIKRIWSSDDEIAILRGMIDYRTEKGSDPYSDMGAFHEFIKNAFHFDVLKNQLLDKIRRLKKKYMNNLGKGEDGEDPVFSKPHECKSFELSKKIWGSNSTGKNKKEPRNIGSSDAVNAYYSIEKVLALPARDSDIAKRMSALSSKGKSEKKVKISSEKKEKIRSEKKEEIGNEKTEEIGSEKEEEIESFGLVNPVLNEVVESGNLAGPVLGKSFLEEGLSLIESSKLKELELKWKKLCMDEAEMYLRKLELIQEQIKLILNAMRASPSMS